MSKITAFGTMLTHISAADPTGSPPRAYVISMCPVGPEKEVRAHAAQNTLSQGSPINSVSQSPNEEEVDAAQGIASRFNHFITHFLCCDVVFFEVPPSLFSFLNVFLNDFSFLGLQLEVLILVDTVFLVLARAASMLSAVPHHIFSLGVAQGKREM